MEFYIKKGETLPLLTMETFNDRRTDSYKSFNSDIENSFIRFSMKNTENGTQKIIMKRAYVTTKKTVNDDTPTEYVIFYKWDKRDTNEKGRYEGEFHISNHEGDTILPIKEKLYINIV
jgi:hypothetical protein